MPRYDRYGDGSQPVDRGPGELGYDDGFESQAPSAYQPSMSDADLYSRSSGRYGSKRGSGSKGAHARSSGVRGHSDASGAPAAYGGMPVAPAAYGEAATVSRASGSQSKRVLKVVGAGVLAFVLVVAAAFLLYMHQLDSKMSLGGDDSDAFDLLGEQVSGPYYMVIIGSDSRSSEQFKADANEEIGDERADVMMLARIDEDEKQVTLLSIPRDYPWIDDEGNVRRINESFYGGAASVVKAVEGVSGVNVTHYARVRFAAFENLVDSLGGVTVDVPMEIGYIDALTEEEITVEAGTQTLSGAEALIFARARHEYDDLDGEPDQIRQSNVRSLVEAIADKLKQAPISDLPNLLLEVAHYVGTDMSSFDALRMGMAFQGDVTFYGTSAPYAGCINEAADDEWLCYDDREGWEKVMAVIDAGEDPSDISYVGDVAYIAGTDEMVVVE